MGSGCCAEPGCRRREPIDLYLADFLPRRAYVVLHRRVVSDHEDGTATFMAAGRHDVTAQLREFIRRNPAWVREQLEVAEHPAPSSPQPGGSDG